MEAPTKKGYTFKGWYNSKGKEVTKIKKGSTGDITLSAKWSAKTYKITYKLDGGKNNSKNPASYKVTKAVKLQNPTKKGYTFKGWYSDKKLTKPVTEIAEGTIGSKTLYAKWTATKYKITYNLKGGKISKDNPASYKVTSSTITLKNPTRKGYKFVGWYNSKGKKVTKISKGSTGNITLTAKWKKK